MKDIIIITNSYPFGNGETYFAPELEYAHNVANISIIPMTEDGSNGYRKLPENVKLLSLEHSRENKIFLLLNVLFSKPVLQGICELICQKKLSVLTIKELFKFVYASKVHYKRILKALKKDYDLSNVILYSYWMDSTSLSISYLKKYGAKAISRCHGGDLYDERLPWKHQFLRKYLVEHLDFVFPVSIQGKKYLDERVGKRNNVVAMHLGIEDHGVCSGSADLPFQIVSCSNAIPLKRIDLIIEALSNLNIDFVWRHFGAGEQLEELKDLASKKLRRGTFFFKGSVANEKLMDFYRTNYVHLFINLSETEGVPVSIMEALSFGIPVIATDVGGVNELVEDNINGRLLPADSSVEQITSSIELFAGLDSSDYLSYRSAARNSFLSKWESSTNFSAFYRILTE